jgi:hypothetical protein
MKKLMGQLWSDDAGIIVTLELLFLYVVLILGLIAGWTNLRNAIDAELTEMAQSILALNQGYSITAAVGCNTSNFSAASVATDTSGTIALSPQDTTTGPVSVQVINQTACP